MSVIADGAIVPRMWRGYDDPGLPVGAYIGNFVTVGDDTGGTNIVAFHFKFESAPADGRFFNIEQLSVFLANGIAITNGFLRVLAFEALGPFIIGERQYRFQLASGLPASLIGFDYPSMPLFLGQSSRLVTADSVVQVGTFNQDLTAWSATIQGYIWEPRSILAPGGLRRPADALYGSGRG